VEEIEAAAKFHGMSEVSPQEITDLDTPTRQLHLLSPSGWEDPLGRLVFANLVLLVGPKSDLSLTGRSNSRPNNQLLDL